MNERRWLLILPWALATLLLVALSFAAGFILFDQRAPVATSSDVGTTAYATAALQKPHGGPGGLMHMTLEGQFAGPLQDTVVQRWHDPVDGTTCYIYVPLAVARSGGPAGLVQYGAANIGTISCFAGPRPFS